MLSIPTFITRAIVTVATAVVIDRVTGKNNTPKATVTNARMPIGYLTVKNPTGHGNVTVPVFETVA